MHVNMRIVGGALLLAASVGACVFHGCKTARENASAATHTLRSEPQGPVPHDQDGVDAAIVAVRAVLSRPGGVVEPELLAADIRASLVALVRGDADAYFEYRAANGAALKREFVESLLDHWYSEKIIGLSPPEGISDKELLRFLWGTAPARRMSIRSVMHEQASAGLGATIMFGDPTADWPFTGAQGSTAVFGPDGGVLTREMGERLDGTSRSAHATFRVILTDGTISYLRLNYFYDDTRRMWVPATIAAAAESGEYWPWPAF